MGPIGGKIGYECVSRDDPKQTIDSHSSVSIHAGNKPSERKKKEAHSWERGGEGSE